MTSTDVTQVLVDQLPDGTVVLDPDILAGYVRDESRLTEHGSPIAVLLPRSTEEVSRCMALAHELGIRVVVRGAGSGLSGAANADDGCLVLSTRRMGEILEIDRDERIAVVQPGLVTAELRSGAAEVGLAYPPDPGSVAFCSIGGNVATNAGGMCCVKYGVTADFVMALEVVLPDGRVLRTGNRTAKGVVGYDLRHLFTGSEGTLGVITEITVRLVPAPQPPATLVATFGSLEEAGAAVASIVADGVQLSMLELLDATTIRAVDALSGMGLGPAEAMLLMQSDTTDAADVIERAGQLCAAALDLALSSDPAEGEMLVEARRLALPALERLGDWLLDDVCVPRRSIVDLVRGIEKIAAERDLTIGVFGHAGDGNMHPTIIFDDSDLESRRAATGAFDDITDLALRLGGTVTGEHGTGRLKAAWAARELDPVARQVQVALKAAIDPHGVLGPSGVLPA